MGGEPISIGESGNHKIPDAFKAFCIIVSFTAANTSRIFVVSVACVRLHAELDHGRAQAKVKERKGARTVGKH